MYVHVSVGVAVLQYKHLKSYSLVVFPDIWMMHLLSFPISLELKGRTLTATLTDAPAMMQVGSWEGARAGDLWRHKCTTTSWSRSRGWKTLVGIITCSQVRYICTLWYLILHDSLGVVVIVIIILRYAVQNIVTSSGGMTLRWLNKPHLRFPVEAWKMQ